MITRRLLLSAASLLPFVPAFTPVSARASETGVVTAALRESSLVYLTPLKSDGSESSCQAEIWFVYDGADLYVVTQSDAWRTEAVRRGLTRTRFWVGDVGQWQRADRRYRQLPELMADASLVDGDEDHERALELFGEKYRGEWLLWGPRFRKGLADGSRAMLRYRPLTV